MRPRQDLGFSTHCVENLGEELIELNKLIEIALCESFTIKICKVISKSFDNFLAVLGSILASG